MNIGSNHAFQKIKWQSREILDANEMLYELELAEHGDVQAQYCLAGIYADRTTVVYDVKKCAEWTRLAERMSEAVESGQVGWERREALAAEVDSAFAKCLNGSA